MLASLRILMEKWKFDGFESVLSMELWGELHPSQSTMNISSSRMVSPFDSQMHNQLQIWPYKDDMSHSVMEASGNSNAVNPDERGARDRALSVTNSGPRKPTAGISQLLMFLIQYLDSESKYSDSTSQSHAITISPFMAIDVMLDHKLSV